MPAKNNNFDNAIDGHPINRTIDLIRIKMSLSINAYNMPNFAHQF